MKKVLFLYLIVLCLTGCATATLLPPTVTRHSTLDGYKYVFIMPSSEKSSVVGGMYNIGYGVYGVTTTHSANPTDLISGYLLDKGFIRIQEINPETANCTLIVSYGETERGYVNLSHKIGIINIVSTKTCHLEEGDHREQHLWR